VTDKPKVDLYSDGACKGNPGPGGWGVLLRHQEKERELSGGEPLTTNNRMELTAVIQGLNALNKPCEVTIFTDSQYVKNGIEQWISQWKARGWRTSAGKPVANQDLWVLLEESLRRHVVTWRWVKGHAGDYGNERADSLANSGVPSLN
jgi:ribonuclease HI